jgi:Suppressor of fused protein (SUFU)
VIDVLVEVRAHLREHFARGGITAEPDEASVTFLGTERIDVLRFGPDDDGVSHYVSLGCSRHPMFDPTEMVTDALHGPRAEVVVALRGQSPKGLARSLAILAAAPAVEGLILEPDALIDLEAPLWDLPSPPGRSAPAPRGAPFTAFLLDRSDINDVPLTAPLPPVTVLSATPITATEAAWVRLKGADAMREAWQQDGVDVRDPGRPAAQPN